MRRLLPHAFEVDARMVFEEVANNNVDATGEELWGMLQLPLCNKVHQAALQDKFMEMRWNERRESFATFAQRLRSASLALPGGVCEEVLLNRLKAGVPTRLKDQAHLISEDFDVVVSKLSRLSSAAQTREAVREVKEDAPPGPAPTSPRQILGQFAHSTCHYCGLKGHISRYCEKKKLIASPRATLTPIVTRGKALGVARCPTERFPHSPMHQAGSTAVSA